MLGVENSQARIAKDGSFEPRNGVKGWAKITDPAAKDGRLGVKFSKWQPILAPYDVIYTDYENLAVVHSCYSLGVWKTEQSWVLTRKPLNPDHDAAEYTKLVGKAKGILES